MPANVVQVQMVRLPAERSVVAFRAYGLFNGQVVVEIEAMGIEAGPVIAVLREIANQLARDIGELVLAN